MIYRNDHYGPIDRFCAKHPRFGIPNLAMYVAIGQVIVGIVDLVMRGRLTALMMFYRPYILGGQVWRLLTFILVPSSTNPFYLLLGCYVIYWTGQMLEREWGTAKFNCFFFTGVLLNILFGLIVGVSSISYVNLSMFFAFAVLFPDMQVLFMFILPVKVKWLAWIDAGFFAWQIFNSLRMGLWLFALLPLVAILNFFIFFWEDMMDALGRGRARAAHKHSAQTINFKKAQKELQQRRGYLHKCAVCGITDRDDPEMEFRYCSKCSGYYCYCATHINNHTHVQ